MSKTTWQFIGLIAGLACCTAMEIFVTGGAGLLWLIPILMFLSLY